MAKKRRKTRGPRKNPKRVAAGRKAARARWGKKTSRKKSRKGMTKAQLERALWKQYLSGNKITRTRKKGKRKTRRSGYLHSAENLANLARGRKIRKANLAHGVTRAKTGGFMGISLNPMFMSTPVKKAAVNSKRMAALAKARAVRAANIIAKKAGITWKSQGTRMNISGSDPRFW